MNFSINNNISVSITRVYVNTSCFISLNHFNNSNSVEEELDCSNSENHEEYFSQRTLYVRYSRLKK